MIDEYRQELKTLYRQIEEVRNDIRELTGKYIGTLGGKRGIYITDHAINRYLERIKGMSSEDIESFSGYETLRQEMLTHAEDRCILDKQLAFFKRGSYGYIIKNLAVLTVIKL